MEASIDLWMSLIGNDQDCFVHLLTHRYHDEFDHQRALIEASYKKNKKRTEVLSDMIQERCCCVASYLDCGNGEAGSMLCCISSSTDTPSIRRR